MKKRKWLISVGIFLVIVAILMIVLYRKARVILYQTHYQEEPSGCKDTFFSNKKVLVVVPHEDDEYTLAGGVLEQYVACDSDIRVVFTTNGDAYGGGDKRIREALRDLEVMGIPTENGIFLGYGDSWTTEYGHIYNAPGDEIITSMLGEKKTYGIEEHPDYHTEKTGRPADYTRDNLVQDLEAVILDFEPDVIYDIDLDEHPDHRSTSLMLDEALAGILQRDDNPYTPMVYKGFGYCTAWDSVDDFYGFNALSTKNPSSNDVMEKRTEYKWSDRVRIPVDARFLSYTKRSSCAYPALEAHSSQDAIANLTKIVNSDKVFWKWETDGLQYQAQVNASSGDASVLKDFKRTDFADICDETSFGEKGIWIPAASDSNAFVTYSFSEPHDIEKVILYDNPSLTDNIIHGKLSFSDGSSMEVTDFPTNGSPMEVLLDKKSGITEVTFSITEREGDKAGLSEFEVYTSKENAFDSANGFIKIMAEDNFLYDYYAPQKKELEFEIYSYPGREINLENDYMVSLDGRTIDNASYPGVNMLRLPYDGKEHILRIQSKDQTQIYDEIRIRPLTMMDRLLISSCQKIEAFRDRDRNKAEE